tara:strand:+ start:2857 stop:3087 length:231 start_codon:yes stop_codon:yes gene_type:complete
MENATWVAVGIVVAYYMWQKTEAKPTHGAPSAQREPDVTRWRHEGDQPIDKTWFDGNVMSYQSSYIDQIDQLKQSL